MRIVKADLSNPRHGVAVLEVLDAYAADGEPRPRLVHRLDKDTSGVLLIARTPGAAASFSKRFAGRSARKVYWALVVGKPDLSEGVIDAPLPRPTGVTPYGRFGDFLFFFSVLTAFILSLWPSIRRSRVQGNRVAI